MNDTHEDDLAWARELFEGARGGEEPAWTPDTGAIGAAGARRRRVRLLGAGTGVAAVIAAATLLAVGLGAGLPRSAAPAAPIPGWGDRPLSDVFQYMGVNGDGATYATANTDEATTQQIVQRVRHSLPQAAARDTAVLLVALDPGLDHITPDGVASPRPTIVADSSSVARLSNQRHLSAFWYSQAADQGRGGPAGTLGVTYLADTAAVSPATTVSAPGAPCGMSAVVPSDPGFTWGLCRITPLADGSRVDTATGAFGSGTEVFAVRVFPNDAGAVVLTGSDFRYGGTGSPTASEVVAPSPWSAQDFLSALSDPQITTALPTDGVPGQPAGFLHPADLGAGFLFNSAASHGSTSQLQLDNGCDDKSVFNLPDGRMAEFDGAVPGDATALVVFEGEYKLPKGSGPATFALARRQGQGGCSGNGADFSKDTVAPLPSGLGDDAFVEYQVGNETVRILMRFGDTVLDTQIYSPGSQKMVDLSSSAGQSWLTGVARQVAARWTAKD